MNITVLVINCGSSSIKFSLFDAHKQTPLIHGLAERLGSNDAALSWHFESKHETPLNSANHNEALRAIIDLIQNNEKLPNVEAIGHRVVHGGESFTESVRITNEVLTVIKHCVPLAPLHNPANLLGIEAIQELYPALPQVAVFDTAFHQTMPPHAYVYPIPYKLYEEHKIRRYGFHGTSHHYVAQQAAKRLNKPLAQCSLISAHLGNGCSTCVIQNGKSLDTSMGLTPLEGVVMGTRSGDIDPSLPGFLADNLGYDLEKTTAMLNKESGLWGISGVSNDMRELLDAAEQGNYRAALAIDIFCYRLAKSIASMTASLTSLDALIFTGGIGEHAATIRSKVVQRLGLLGLQENPDRNNQHGKHSNGYISLDDSTAILVIPTNEELMIAQDTLALIQS